MFVRVDFVLPPRGNDSQTERGLLYLDFATHILARFGGGAQQKAKFCVTFVPNLVLPKSAGPTMSYLVSEG